jgi:hypothetical protein
MDPVSILGLLSSAGTIATAIAVTIKTLSDLRGQYQDADVRIRLLIGELSTVKSALSQINDWAHYLDDTHRQADVVEALQVSLEGCQLAIDALSEEVKSLLKGATPDSSLGFRTRTRYVWGQSSLIEHENRMRAQTAALQLLLKAVQWQALLISDVSSFADHLFIVATQHPRRENFSGMRTAEKSSRKLPTRPPPYGLQ